MKQVNRSQSQKKKKKKLSFISISSSNGNGKRIVKISPFFHESNSSMFLEKAKTSKARPLKKKYELNTAM